MDFALTTPAGNLQSCGGAGVGVGHTVVNQALVSGSSVRSGMHSGLTPGQGQCVSPGDPRDSPTSPSGTHGAVEPACSKGPTSQAYCIVPVSPSTRITWACEHSWAQGAFCLFSVDPPDPSSQHRSSE